MDKNIKNVAIIGGNKEGLALLPVILGDKSARLAIIADPNPHAMLFKLKELGYQLSPRYNIKVTHDLEEIKKLPRLDIIINALHFSATEEFLDSPEFRKVEKLSPLSAKLLWQVRAATDAETKGVSSYTDLLSSFREIVDVIRLTSDRNELLSDILNLAIESTRAERGSIMLLADDKTTLRMEVGRGIDEEVIRKIRVDVGEGISGKVARDGKPLMISGKASEDDFTSLDTNTRGVQSALCVPLIVGSGIIGVINVSSSGTYEFTDEDLGFLTHLAGLVAEIIDRSSEYEQLRIDAAKFSLWKELQKNLSDDRPLELRLSAVCKKLSELVTGLTCHIYLYDEERKRFVLRGSNLTDSAPLNLLSFASGESIEGSIIENLKEVVLVDRIADKTVRRAYVALPMLVNEELVGAFVGELVSKQGLTKYNESFLRDMSNLIAESVFEHAKNDEELLRSKRIFAVDEAGLEMLSMKDTRRLINVVVSDAASFVGAEGALLRVDEKGDGNFSQVSSCGLEKEVLASNVRPIEEETFNELLRREEPIMREFSLEAGPYVKGIVSCPILVDGKIRGVLSLFNKVDMESRVPRPFVKLDKEVLVRFSAYVAKVLPDIIKNLNYIVEFSLSSPKTFVQRVEGELKKAIEGSGKKPGLMAIRSFELATLIGSPRKEFLKRILAFIQDKTGSFDIVAMLDEDTLGIFFEDTADSMLDSMDKTFLTDAPVEFKSTIHCGHSVYPDGGDSFERILSATLIRLKDSSERLGQG
jgi:putative methionine-R-sulfoxide reductase with GAF domain